MSRHVITVADGHYPSVRELKGFSFTISVVMAATNLTFDQGVRREDELQFIAKACNAHDDLLALAKQYASECGECSGAGLVTIFNHDGHGSDADDQPCPECADIRAVIAKVTL